MNNAILKKDKSVKIKNMILFYFILVLSLFMTIINVIYTDRPDIQDYRHYYNNIEDILQRKQQLTDNKGFLLTMYCFKQSISSNFGIFLFFYYSFGFILLLLIFKKIYGSILFIIPFMLYVYYPGILDIVQLKNFYAQIFILISLLFLACDKRKLSLFFAFIAPLFHVAYIIWFLVILILPYLKTKKNIILLFLLEMLIVFGLIRGNIIYYFSFFNISILSRFNHYNDSAIRLTLFISPFLYFPIVIYIYNSLIFFSKANCFFKYNYSLFKLTRFAIVSFVILIPALSVNGIFGRFIRIPIIIFYLYFGKIFRYLPYNKRYKYLIVFLLFMFMALFKFLIVNNQVWVDLFTKLAGCN